MRPNLNYVQRKFREFNQQFFDNKLEEPELFLSLRKGALGYTWAQRNRMTNVRSFRIEISVREDFPEEEYIDTILHEMIHYWILSNDLQDDAPHGTIFHQKAKEITLKSGYRISVYYTPDETAAMRSDGHLRYVLAVRMEGQWFVSVIAKKAILNLHKALSASPNIEQLEWYATDRVIFSTFPTSIHARLSPITEENRIKWFKDLTPIQILK